MAVDCETCMFQSWFCLENFLKLFFVWAPFCFHIGGSLNLNCCLTLVADVIFLVEMFQTLLIFYVFFHDFLSLQPKVSNVNVGMVKTLKNFPPAFLSVAEIFSSCSCMVKTLKKFWTKSMCFFTVVSSSYCNCISVHQKKSKIYLLMLNPLR